MSRARKYKFNCYVASEIEGKLPFGLNTFFAVSRFEEGGFPIEFEPVQEFITELKQ